MEKKLIAQSSITISAPISDVWDALINPAAIKNYMFGTNAVSDWKEGSKIIWEGEWEGKSYKDKGEILRLTPEKILQYSHYSPLSGETDEPDNYHVITFELSEEKNGVQVSLSQDKNKTEKEREHSEKNWEMVLESLKKFVEKPI